MSARRIVRVSITVSDLDRIGEFYCDMLGFERLPLPHYAALQLHLGGQEIELTAAMPGGDRYPADSTAHDLWFQHLAIVVSDIEAAWRRIGNSVRPITEGAPQILPPNTGSVRAWKFRDPDGHPLELLEFPPGTGDPAWQRRDALFLGIDHTAIVVSDAALSAQFYEQRLGLSRMAQSVNRGPAQERLDATAGDVVDVVALRAADAATPHLELLGYRVPRPRVPSRPVTIGDIASARLVVEVDDGDDMMTDPDDHLIQRQRAART